MLTETEVIDAVCEFLKAHGYSIKQRCTVTKKGDDIVAISPDRKGKLVVEAKGETSAQPHTARYQKTFSRNQAYAHVAKAFYRAAQTVGTNGLSAVALPKNDNHVFFIEKVSEALRRLNVEVFWVLPDHTILPAGYGPILWRR